MRKPNFNCCSLIGIILIAVGAIFILFNMSFKAWMILIGLLFVALGIFLMK